MVHQDRWSRFMSSLRTAFELYEESSGVGTIEGLQTHSRAVYMMETAIHDLARVIDVWPEQRKGLKLLETSLRHFWESMKAYYWVTHFSVEGNFMKVRRYVRDGRTATWRSIKAWRKAGKHLDTRLIEEIAEYLGPPETAEEQRWW